MTTELTIEDIPNPEDRCRKKPFAEAKLDALEHALGVFDWGFETHQYGPECFDCGGYDKKCPLYETLTMQQEKSNTKANKPGYVGEPTPIRINASVD